MRRATLLLALVLGVTPLGGCAINLFGDVELGVVDEERVEELEHRMDVLEETAEQRGL